MLYFFKVFQYLFNVCFIYLLLPYFKNSNILANSFCKVKWSTIILDSEGKVDWLVKPMTFFCVLSF